MVVETLVGLKQLLDWKRSSIRQLVEGWWHYFLEEGSHNSPPGYLITLGNVWEKVGKWFFLEWSNVVSTKIQVARCGNKKQLDLSFSILGHHVFLLGLVTLGIVEFEAP